VARNLVIVSGASSGIGRGLVETVPYADARVIDVSRRGAPGCEHLAADLAVVFFHCAGTLEPMGYAGEVDAAAYARNVLLNSAAPQVLGDAFLRAARRTRAKCHLVMISSGAASNVYEGWTSYGAAKAAVDQWVRTAGAEQARRGGRCRILAVAPGVVATAMQERIRATSADDFPELAKFVELHQSGALRDPKTAAHELWSLLDRHLTNGTILDLRNQGNQGDGPQ
jgi:benzil reductase ((S)-benzoin forming)